MISAQPTLKQYLVPAFPFLVGEVLLLAHFEQLLSMSIS